MSTNCYYIPHQPGTSIIFNLKKAQREKKQKDANGNVIFAQNWRDDPDDARPLHFRIQKNTLPYLVGHHGHEEIFCGQAMSRVQLNMYCKKVAHIVILNNTKRRNIGPTPRNYVFTFYSAEEAAAFMLSMNVFIDFHCEALMEKAKKNDSEDEEEEEEEEEQDKDDQSVSSCISPLLKRCKNNKTRRNVKKQQEVEEEADKDESTDECIFEDDKFTNTQDPYPDYPSDS